VTTCRRRGHPGLIVDNASDELAVSLVAGPSMSSPADDLAALGEQTYGQQGGSSPVNTRWRIDKSGVRSPRTVPTGPDIECPRMPRSFPALVPMRGRTGPRQVW